MHKAGRIIAILGVIIAAIGLVTGFSLMSSQPQLAKVFLLLTPVGFLFLFTGVITAILFGEAVEPRQPD